MLVVFGFRQLRERLETMLRSGGSPRMVGFLGSWPGRLETAIVEAQADGAIDAAEDADQLAFELEAALFLANAQYVVIRTSEPLDRARRAFKRLLPRA